MFRNRWVIAAASAATAVGVYIVVKYFRGGNPEEEFSRTITRTPQQHSLTPGHSPHRNHIEVAELWVYPIKGCGGTQQHSVELTPTGFAYDRHWCVVRQRPSDGKLEVLAQDRFPKLRKATAEIVTLRDGKKAVKVTSKSLSEPLQIPADDEETEPNSDSLAETVSSTSVTGDTLKVELFGVEAEVKEVGTNASRWFTKLMGEPVMLCRLAKPRKPKTSQIHRGTSCVESDSCAMHDYCTIHLISTDGIRWLNERMPEGTTVTSHQFRANVVITGLQFPKEDNWKRFNIGDIPMRVAKLSGRCVTPTTNEDGVRHPLFEPTATLRKYRSCYHQHQLNEGMEDAKLCYMFGLDVFHDYIGDIAVGDPVSVLETQPAGVCFLSPNRRD